MHSSINLLPLLTTLLVFDSSEDNHFVNEMCETQSLDIAFNFYDQEMYPNGVMIRKDNFTSIFKDDLLSKSWIKETQIMPKYRNNNFTAGFSIRVVPKCAPISRDYCSQLQKAYKLQMLVIPDANNTKAIHFLRENKFISGEEIPWYSDSNPRLSPLIPDQWSADTDLVAYRSQAFELVFVSNSQKTITWFSLQTDRWLQTKDHKYIRIKPNLQFFSVFELNKNIYLLSDRDSPRIFLYHDYQYNPNERIVTEIKNETLYSLFSCSSNPSESETFVEIMAELIVFVEHLIMVVLTISFLAFIVYQFWYYRKKEIDPNID